MLNLIKAFYVLIHSFLRTIVKSDDLPFNKKYISDLFILRAGSPEY
jgi:hypothetical protein